MTNSIPERLVSAQAKIEAATATFLQQGGSIAQVDSYGRPVEHLSWKDEADRRRASGLFFVEDQRPPKPVRRPRTAAESTERRDRQLKNAIQASSKAKQARRTALAPKVRALASTCPVCQIARQLNISAGTVRRIGREHGITLNTSRGAMPTKLSQA